MNAKRIQKSQVESQEAVVEGDDIPQFLRKDNLGGADALRPYTLDGTLAQDSNTHSEAPSSPAETQEAQEATQVAEEPAKPASEAPKAPSAAVVVRTDIPMPSAKGGKASVYPWDKLEVGAMFFVAGGKIESFYQSCSANSKKHNRKFAARKFTLDGVEGVGVWRIS